MVKKSRTQYSSHTTRQEISDKIACDSAPSQVRKQNEEARASKTTTRDNNLQNRSIRSTIKIRRFVHSEIASIVRTFGWKRRRKLLISCREDGSPLPIRRLNISRVNLGGIRALLYRLRSFLTTVFSFHSSRVKKKTCPHPVRAFKK